MSRLTLNDCDVKIESLDECIPPLTSVSSILHRREHWSSMRRKTILHLHRFQYEYQDIAGGLQRTKQIAGSCDYRCELGDQDGAVEHALACGTFTSGGADGWFLICSSSLGMEQRKSWFLSHD
jgi:hypothetical protein